MRSNKRFKETLKTGLEELGEFSASRYALLGATVTGLAFEWGPLNEALLGYVGVTAHEKAGLGSSLGESIVGRFVTGAATGSASFLEQATVGTLTALSVNQFPKTFKKWQELRKEDANNSVSATSSALTALMLGSSMAVVEKNIVEKDVPFKDNAVLVLKTSAIVGACNLLLGSTVSAGLEVLENNGQENITTNIENMVKNPLVYIALFGIIKSIHLLKSKKMSS